MIKLYSWFAILGLQVMTASLLMEMAQAEQQKRAAE